MMERGWQFWRNVFTAACYASIMSIQITSSIVAPIFAIAGPRFGLSTGEVAQIYSIYYLPNVGSSLAAGVLASLCGRRRVLFVGCVVLSAGCIALGLVPGACASAADAETDDGILFTETQNVAGGMPDASTSCLYRSFVAARIMQGTGVALSQTCLFAMLADLWPGDTGKVMGAAELAGGLSYALGPPTGGFLYQTGGFIMPFVIQGFLPLFLVIILQMALSKLNNVKAPHTAGGAAVVQLKSERENASRMCSPTISNSDTDELDVDTAVMTATERDFELASNDEDTKLILAEAADSNMDDEFQGQEDFDKSAFGLIRMWWQLCTPGLLLVGITTGMEQGAWGHYQLSNPPFLVRHFQFKPADVALFFAIVPMFYILFSFPAGALCDRALIKHKYLLGFGCVGLSIAFCCFTSPWSPHDPTLLAAGLSNVLFGAASTLVTVPQMPDLQQGASRQLPHLSEEGTKRRTNLVAATYTTFQNVGGLLGPLIGDMATTRYGVADSLLLTGVMYGGWSMVMIGYGSLCEGQPTHGYETVGGAPEHSSSKRTGGGIGRSEYSELQSPERSTEGERSSVYDPPEDGT